MSDSQFMPNLHWKFREKFFLENLGRNKEEKAGDGMNIN